jgi:hypothetical protein
MGILDDAIREHLELIRRRGATDSEVQRLEDEAFGPPTRPDEADFPGSEEARASSGNGVATEAAVEEPGPEDAAMHEDVTTLLPAEEREPAKEPIEGPEPSEQPVEGAFEAGPESAEEETAPPAVPEEPVAEVHPVVEEPAPEAQEEPSDEASPPAEEDTTLYDQSRDELDVDLRLDEPSGPEAPPEEAPSEEHDIAEPEGAMPLEPPIESLDTVEHRFPEEIAGPEQPHEEDPPSDEHAVHEDEAPSGDTEEGGEGDGEDVLADTPDFLKDQPEDDELWFEQGEPKDFDF